MVWAILFLLGPPLWFILVGIGENLVRVVEGALRDPTAEERHKLRHLSEGPQIAVLSTADGTSYEVAAAAEQLTALRGPTATQEVPPSIESEKR